MRIKCVMNCTKKAAMPLEVIAWAIIVLVVVVVLLLIFQGPSQRAHTYFGETLDSLGDAACLSQGMLTKVSPKNDIDGDNRPDSCDVCVCEGVCPNGKNSKNDEDDNGNKIPDGCDDLNDPEDHWWPGCKKEDRNNAFSGKNPGSIVVLDKQKRTWQCRLKTTPSQSVSLPK